VVGDGLTGGRRPAARVQGGCGGSPPPPPAGTATGEAQQRRERAVACGAVEVAELDLGHGSEGEVV
jgi:hypothetical protein